jgi:hypothetical protein
VLRIRALEAELETVQEREAMKDKQLAQTVQELNGYREKFDKMDQMFSSLKS